MLIDDETLDPVELEAALDEIRAALVLDGGGIKLLDVDGSVVRLKMVGSCKTCPSKPMTQRYGIEAVLRGRIGPRIRVVWDDELPANSADQLTWRLGARL